MKTYIVKASEVKRQWYIVDASDKILGRLATRVATILMGKHKPTYATYLDTGDFVVVVNADKVKFTGRKLTQKKYQRFSGYPSGRRERSLSEMMKRDSSGVVRLAVTRMLPRTTLGRHMASKLKVYSDDKHPHEAQKPMPLEIKC